MSNGFLGSKVSDLVPKKKKQDKDDIIVPPEVGLPGRQGEVIAKRLAGGTGGKEADTADTSLKDRVTEVTSQDPAKALDEVKSYYYKAADVGKFDDSGFQKRLDELDKQLEQNKAGLKRGELYESLAHSVVQLAAGLHGLKTGQDLSGLKFDKANWEKKMDHTLQEFRNKQDLITGARSEARAAHTEAGRAAEREAERKSRGAEAGARIGLAKQDLQARQEQAAASREAAEASKEQTRLLRESIADTKIRNEADIMLSSDKDDAQKIAWLRKNAGLSEAEAAELVKQYEGSGMLWWKTEAEPASAIDTIAQRAAQYKRGKPAATAPAPAAPPAEMSDKEKRRQELLRKAGK